MNHEAWWEAVQTLNPEGGEAMGVLSPRPMDGENITSTQLIPPTRIGHPNASLALLRAEGFMEDSTPPRRRAIFKVLKIVENVAHLADTMTMEYKIAHAPIYRPSAPQPPAEKDPWLNARRPSPY